MESLIKMGHEEQRLEMSKAEKSGNPFPGAEERSQKTDLMQKKSPTLATLFRPGNYLISREIMMHLDGADLANLRLATERVDNDFFGNLKQVTRPQWVCEGTTNPDLECYGYHVKPCQGFNLKLRSGLAHGPTCAICTHCNGYFNNSWPIDKTMDQEQWTITAELILPFRRIAQNAIHPKYPCSCIETVSKLPLCGDCREEHTTAYWDKVRSIALENPQSMEYMTTEEPWSDAHIMKPNRTFCRKCQIWHKRANYLLRQHGQGPADSGFPLHFTTELEQTLQCVICEGAMRGYVVVGKGGFGLHSEYGAGRKIRQDMPWIPDVF